MAEAYVDENQSGPQRTHLAERLGRGRRGARNRDALPVKARARYLEKAPAVVDQQAAYWYEISVTVDGNPSDVDRPGRLVTLRPTGALVFRIVPAAQPHITASARHRVVLSIRPAFQLAGSRDPALCGVPFALTWWCFTFPVGTCVTGTIALAARSHAEALRGASVLLYGFLVAAWLVVAVRTAHGSATGRLFRPMAPAVARP